MPLVQSQLEASLETGWLVTGGASHPQSAAQSGERFARAVAQWLSTGQANGFPCTTAMARMGQLAQSAALALQAQAAVAAGNALGVAIGLYILGQVFGAGVAGVPVALSAAQAQIGAVFANLDMAASDRARSIAGACTLLATSTLVVFPAPMPPGPIV